MNLQRGVLKHLSLLLPVILGLLPLLILGSDVSRARMRQREDAKRAWVGEMRLLGERLREVTTPSFWIEATSRRLRVTVERSAAGRSGNAEALQTGLGRGLAAWQRRWVVPPGARDRQGFGEPLLWAAPVGPLRPGSSGTLFTGPGFQNRYRAAFADLLRDLGEAEARPADPKRAETKARQMRTILGAGVSTRLFLPEAAGRPFPIIYQQRQGLAVWDVIRRRTGGRLVPVAAFLVIVPVAEDPSSTVLGATCRYWSHLLGTRGRPPGWPAFLPLPGTNAARGPATVHRQLRDPGARRLLGRLRREFAFERSSQPALPPKVSLLAGRLGQVVDEGGWWATVCSLSPLNARIGVLVAPAPRMPTLPGEFLDRAVRLVLIAGWSVYLGWWWLRRRPPTWGVHGTLMLWFLGLAATPLALVVGAGERLNADLAANLQDALDRRLHKVGQQIESGSLTVDHRSWRSARAIARHPQLRRLVGQVPGNPRLARRLVDACWDRCQRRGMDPILVVLTDGKHLTQSRSLPNADLGVIDTTARLYHAMAQRWLRERPGVQPDRLSADFRAGPPKRAPSSSRDVVPASRNDFSTVNANSLAEAGGITTFNYAGHSTVRFFDVVRAPNGRDAMLFIVWNPDGAGRRYMKDAVHRAFLGHRDCYLAAFRVEGIRLTLVEQAGDSAGTALLKRDARSWGIAAATPGHRRMAFTGSRLPGYLWVVGGSTQPITARRQEESAHLAAALAVLILLVISGAGLLARWLASPIVRMTDGLQRIAAGDLTPVGLGEGRADELGEAGMVLDTMTGWLAERQVMSRFVAPQVLSVVEEVEASVERPGEVLEAVALVSDIRGFTGLSERHPPTAVFAMINEHIERMTRVIQKHGGVIDRFIGDAIQAVFYADTSGSMVSRALLAAEDLCREHRHLLEERERKGQFGYEIGVGLDLGRIVTGVIGDPDVRLDLSALGEPMQRAADLESASRHVQGRPIVCSSSVRERAGPPFSFAPLPTGASPASGGWVLTDEASLPGGDSGVGQPPDLVNRLGEPAPAEVRADRLSGGTLRSHARPVAEVRNLWAALAGIVLILWLLPLLAVHDAKLRATADDDQRLVQTLVTTLDDDWARCERILDPTTPIALGF